jgi:hypothetical protein
MIGTDPDEWWQGRDAGSSFARRSMTPLQPLRKGES